MAFGLSLAAFTQAHVVVSLVGIVSGLIMIAGMIMGKCLEGWTKTFLVSTVLTCLTGFLFPFHGVTPAIVLGVLTLIALLLADVALFGRELSGRWRGVFAISAVVAEYFNVFVLVAQLFAKVPALKAVAPTQASPLFGAAQLVVLALFVALGVLAFKRLKA